MHKVAIAAVALAFTGSAYAADLPSKAPPIVAPVAPSWTGWYLGINGGGVWGTTDPSVRLHDTNYVASAVNIITTDGSHSFHNSGGLAGVQFGYLLQNGSVVAGLEASFDWFRASGSATRSGTFFGAPFDTFNTSVSSNWLALFLGRVGLVMGAWYPYVTGGLAVSQLKYNSTFTDVISPAVSTISISQVRYGPTAGAGLEYRFDSHWSLRGEWLYMVFNAVDGTAPNINPLTGVQYNLPAGEKLVHNATFSENIGRLALSYKF